MRIICLGESRTPVLLGSALFIVALTICLLAWPYSAFASQQVASTDGTLASSSSFDEIEGSSASGDAEASSHGQIATATKPTVEPHTPSEIVNEKDAKELVAGSAENSAQVSDDLTSKSGGSESDSDKSNRSSSIETAFSKDEEDVAPAPDSSSDTDGSHVQAPSFDEASSFEEVVVSDGTSESASFHPGDISTSGTVALVHHADAANNSAISEANTYLKGASPFAGKAAFVLRYDRTINKELSDADVLWTREWLEYVKRCTGVSAFLDLPESFLTTVDWSSLSDFSLYSAINASDDVPSPDSDAMRVGEVVVGNSWIYISGSSHRAESGFVYIPKSDKWVYYDPSSFHMLYGEHAIDGHWYNMEAGTGKLSDGFVYQPNDKKWVFYDRTMRYMVYGQQCIDGGWYYFQPDSGAVSYGWVLLSNPSKWVYYDTPSGRMIYGWHTINGKRYYFDQYTGRRYSDYEAAVLIWGSGTRALMESRANNFSSSTGWLIMVDRGACRVGVYTGSSGNWVNRLYVQCTPGKPSTPTITGTYTTKYRKAHLSDTASAKFCTNISGGYFFHSILNSTSELGNHLSHGCIRMNWPDAYFIYTQVPLGTTVNIYN